ncbi:fungal specific transcription factor [Fusarium denticulatum]|uniref:Fungal specific transcription factor n=1 Tax=Fusarium denticulatum TaxID=48507 RepID=A0A8H5T9K2_9HYPO|nr:fungal specific transcription factor [Fusarium denticulatum]
MSPPLLSWWACGDSRSPPSSGPANDSLQTPSADKKAQFRPAYSNGLHPLLFPAALLFAHSPGPSSDHDGMAKNDELYIDRILRCGAQDVVLCGESTVVKAPDDTVPSSSISFFSNDSMTLLASRLGTHSLRELVENLDDLIKKRVCQKQTFGWDGIEFRKPEPVMIQSQMALAYIQAFFVNIHPVYPFLDRQGFATQASDAYLDDILQASPAFSALYHCVLALGSQFFDCGSFVPHVGRAWDLFQVSLGKLPEILAPPVMLINLQALTAMLLVDEDIGCVIPIVPESFFENYDWFTSAIRLARISSLAYSSLFSVSASARHKATLANAIVRIRYLLESWRMSIPPSFRPGNAIRHDDGLTQSTKLVLLQTQYAYYNIVFATERLAIHMGQAEGERFEENKSCLMSAARRVIELIVFVDFEPHLPILGALPGSIISEFATIARQYALSSRQGIAESGSASPGYNPDQTAGTVTTDLILDTTDGPDNPSLNYLAPNDDVSSGPVGELKTLFGWVFPDWGNI